VGKTSAMVLTLLDDASQLPVDDITAESLKSTMGKYLQYQIATSRNQLFLNIFSSTPLPDGNTIGRT
jgi:hypothetical protein